MCEVASSAGLISGFVQGVLAPLALLADIFWDVTVYDKCQNSWWYDFAFLGGVGTFGLLTFRLGLPFFMIAFVLWVISLFIKLTLWLLPLIIVGIIAAIALDYFQQRRQT